MIGRVKYVLLITFFGWSISCKSGEKSSNAMGIEIGEEVQFKKLMRLSGNFELSHKLENGIEEKALIEFTFIITKDDKGRLEGGDWSTKILQSSNGWKSRGLSTEEHIDMNNYNEMHNGKTTFWSGRLEGCREEIYFELQLNDGGEYRIERMKYCRYYNALNLIITSFDEINVPIVKPPWQALRNQDKKGSFMVPIDNKEFAPVEFTLEPSVRTFEGRPEYSLNFEFSIGGQIERHTLDVPISYLCNEDCVILTNASKDVETTVFFDEKGNIYIQGIVFKGNKYSAYEINWIPVGIGNGRCIEVCEGEYGANSSCRNDISSESECRDLEFAIGVRCPSKNIFEPGLNCGGMTDIEHHESIMNLPR